MQLTIDSDLQRAAEEGFKAGGFNGAAVVMDPSSGEVLAFTSRPGFDPNDFAAGIDRATSGRRSTPTAEAAAEPRDSRASTRRVDVQNRRGDCRARGRRHHARLSACHCGGGATFFGRFFQCWKRGGHGSVDMRHAIEQSCNVFHYTIGNMVGVDRIHKWATLLGLGEKTGIDLPNEIEGLVPSTEWKRRRYSEKWYAGETISVVDRTGTGVADAGVAGRHDDRRSPTAAHAFVPHLLKAIDEGNGWTAGQRRRRRSRRVQHEAGNDRRAFTTACFSSSTARAPVAAREFRAETYRARRAPRRSFR